MQLPSAEQRIFFERAASQYQADLASDTRAQAYLRRRGIGPEAASTFRLGVLRSPLPGHEPYAGRLVIPYITPQGGVVTFTFRCLEDHVCKETVIGRRKDGSPRYCPKYKAPDGMDRTLYNVSAFKAEGDVIYVCEGEIDAITLTLCGYPAVGVPGVNNWKPQFSRCFKDFQTIYCVADADDAGYQLSRLLASELNSHTVRPPEGQDVNSTYVQGGMDAVHRWLAGAAQLQGVR